MAALKDYTSRLVSCRFLPRISYVWPSIRMSPGFLIFDEGPTHHDNPGIFWETFYRFFFLETQKSLDDRVTTVVQPLQS